MSSDIQSHNERRASNERRNVVDRRTDSDRRDQGDRRNLLIGIGGKLVAAPQPRDASNGGLPGFPHPARTAGALEFISPEGLYMPARRLPLSPAVRAGNMIFVSGTPGFDAEGRLAVGDFGAQMQQVMLNIGSILKAAGTDWAHVVKINVLLTRSEDVAEMNRIYEAHFADGKYPARTTAIVAALPHPDFLLEIECVAQAG